MESSKDLALHKERQADQEDHAKGMKHIAEARHITKRNKSHPLGCLNQLFHLSPGMGDLSRGATNNQLNF